MLSLSGAFDPVIAVRIHARGHSGQQQQGGDPNSGGGTGAAAASPNEVLEQAQDLAQQLISQPPEKIRETLQGIKAQGNLSLYSATKQALEDLRSQGKSQGVAQMKGQQQNGQQ